jgi:hypothetical protein
MQTVALTETLMSGFFGRSKLTLNLRSGAIEDAKVRGASCIVVDCISSGLKQSVVHLLFYIAAAAAALHAQSELASYP